MAKPDSVGFWYSRKGYSARLFPVNGSLGVATYDMQFKPMWYGEIANCVFPDDDWLPAAPPEFPELPPKPKLVYAQGDDYNEPQWLTTDSNSIHSLSRHHMREGYYKVIPHPDNDPEAVELIESAR